METKDYIIISFSGCALAISIVSLIITLIQKNKETKRTIRKTISDTLESISKIGIETTKLRATKDIDFNSETNILLRRNYNSQRRILIAHADYLIQRYDNLATEIDCNILAGAYSTIGDQEKAELFWEKTINKSISKPIRLMNLRGYGAFLFRNENEKLGRKYFNEGLLLDLPENDENKILKIDTYLMLCDLEKEFGSKEYYEASLTNAMEVLSKIKSSRRKEEMYELIKNKLPKVE